MYETKFVLVVILMFIGVFAILTAIMHGMQYLIRGSDSSISLSLICGAIGTITAFVNWWFN